MSSYLTHQKLVDELASKVAADWKLIGYGLLSPDVVDNEVAGEASGCRVQLDDTVKFWLRTGNATMEGLIRAVQSPAVGPNRQVSEALLKMLKEIDPSADGCSGKHPLTTDDFAELRRLLSPLAYDWYALGIQLQILPEALKRFEHPSVPKQSQRRLHDLLEIWIEKGEDVTLEKLTEVLAGPTVGNRALALKLQKDYKGHKIVMMAPNPGEEGTQEEEAAEEDQMECEVPCVQEQINEVQGGIS